MKRRHFISTSALGSYCLLINPLELISMVSEKSSVSKNRIQKLTISLLEKWCKGLYDLQTITPGEPESDGGIFSPGDNAYLGRSADAIYPFLWMARHTGDEKYITAAKKLYDWEQNNCWNDECGCWFNDPGQPNGWKPITVFAAITKMEAIEHYGDLLGAETVEQWTKRLRRAAEYMYDIFHIEFPNINYPATATYALFKLGKLFGEQKYIDRAALLADQLMDFFTSDGLLFGEGRQDMNASGQYAVDLGYNVEESLPALAMYSRLTGNKKLEEKVLHSMKVHLEFMLPNGGWDNSWGTRQFKWTMWGSRTSDGCHPGYYLFSDLDSGFLEAVYRNLKCLEDSTFENILHSGPHEYLEKVAPSTHHTFDHAKALVKLLKIIPKHQSSQSDFSPTILPREKEYGLKHFKDINTILFSRGPWRGTVTAYNVKYKDRPNGHPTGGVLSCLYHVEMGMLSASSMTKYERWWEKGNMLDSSAVEHFMNLTPRIELVTDKNDIYRNISDFNASMKSNDDGDELTIHTFSALTNEEQEQPCFGAVKVFSTYKINRDSFSISISIDEKPLDGKLKYIFPVISSNQEKLKLGEKSLEITKEQGRLIVESNYLLNYPVPDDKRAYNFIPGLQAFPIEIDCSELHSEKLILKFITSSK